MLQYGTTSRHIVFVRSLFLSLSILWSIKLVTGYQICHSRAFTPLYAKGLGDHVNTGQLREIKSSLLAEDHKDTCVVEKEGQKKVRKLRPKERKEILRKILEDKNSNLIRDLVNKLKPEELFVKVERTVTKKAVKAPKRVRVKENEEEVTLVEDTGYDEPTQINHVKHGNFVVYKNEVYTISAIQHIAQARTKGHYKVKMQGLHTTRESSFSFPDGAKLNVLVPRKFQCTYINLDRMRDVYIFKTELSEVLIPASTNIEALRYLKPGLKVTLIRWKDKVLSLYVPSRIEYKVVDVNTGNYAATLENGLVVMVPTYIKVNDHIEVNTNKGEFLRRSIIG
ncbi:conserved hypothetical protein [Theileria equi strain WA]|uniref:Elongation factor P C-terminal domain-containing protein n=1 Tax=Theileria equi strain WA TaxID=1537102 RepID=L1LCD4_THEEQ|nr:conserved hypothetical protein [Theileria equi strain WA]EKX72939.1 conserved hypothetical protein [Theileria equi strain WA]|eukprot:XP_004832391.1 conserved hypothetical protein [Theileria equi strain WA]